MSIFPLTRKRRSTITIGAFMALRDRYCSNRSFQISLTTGMQTGEAKLFTN